MSEQLAILGGKKTLATDRHNKWPQIDESDKKAVMAVLDRGILSGSEAPEAKALQAEFAEAQGAKYALLCHSGTSALQVAVGALGIGEGDEVIMPAYSFVATALSVIQQGAIPVFVDVGPDGNIDPQLVEAAISPRTKAIMPVHVHGCPADLNALLAICKKHNLKLIEDAAQAHLATYDGKKVGTFGQGAGFSLQSSKNLSAGEGGIYTTNDEALFERANQVRNFAQNLLLSDAKHYDLNRPLDGHKALASNGIGSMYRGNEMMAAFARTQLKKLPALTARAQENASALRKVLEGLPGFSAPVVASNRTSVYHKFRVAFDVNKLGIDLAPEQARTALIAALRGEGLEVVMWQSEPLPQFPLFQEMRGFGKGFPFSASDTERLRANYTHNYAKTKEILANSFVLFSQTCPLIAQTTELVPAYVQAFEKVWAARAELPKVYRQITA